MTSLALACKLNAARTPTSLALRALAAVKRAGGTVLGAGAATPVLGPELVTNGDFSNGTTTGWTASGATLSVVDGQMQVQTSAAAVGWAHQSFATVAGKKYLLVLDTNVITGTGLISIGTGPGGTGSYLGTAFTGAGPKAIEFTATSATTFVNLFQYTATAGLQARFDNISVKEILGYTYGNPPVRNYFDSAGTDILDSVTQVDQPVGLVLDAAGTVGADRVTDGNNESALFAIQGGFVSSDTVARASAPGGGFAASSTSTTSASTAHRFYGISPMLAGKTYQLSGRFYVPTGGIGSFKIYDNADGSWFGVSSSTKDQWVPFSVIRTPKATNWDLGIGDNVANVVTAGQVAFWIDDLSITELTGNHATQATTGSKPTLRRGLVNQLLWSGDFSNAAWSKSNASISSVVSGSLTVNKLIDNATNGAHYVNQSATPANGTNTFSARLKADGKNFAALECSGQFVYFDLASGTVGLQNNAVGEIQADGDGWYICSITFTTTAVGKGFFIYTSVSAGAGGVLYAGDGTSGILLHRAALFTGSVTAAQIQAAGGIPLTTTAPASSALGNYWWQFDPAAPGDFLQTASPLFTTADADGFVCVGVETPATASAITAIFTTRSGAAACAHGIFQDETGKLFGYWQGGNSVMLLNPTATLGQKVVASCHKGAGNSREFNVNGVSVATSTTALVDAPVTDTWIGSSFYGGMRFTGSINAVVVCPTLPPAADRALIRAWVAKQQGQTL